MNLFQRCLLPIVGIFCHLTIFAQTFIYEGRVVDDKDVPMETVSVSFLRENKSICQFAITDADGKFQIQMKEQPVFIFFSYLGYKTMVVPISDYRKGGVYRMVPTEFKLKEVEVTSKRLQVHEDTLVYAVSGYKMPQDRSIADVLRKMPGIEVLPNGSIRFEDKSISKLYIEGMDLMGNNYALATNNLSGKVVKEVQVLRNHQQIAALRGKNFSEQAAINLVLQDDVKFTLSGILEAGGGWNHTKDGLWNVRAMAMLFGKKHQNLSLYKSNNVGINTAHELTPQITESDWVIPSTQMMLQSPAVRMDLIDEERYLDNKEHLAATNHLMQFNKKNSLRLQFNYLNADRQQTDETTTRYFYPNQTVTYNELNQIDTESDQLQGEITYERNADRKFIKNRLSGTWKRDQALQDFLMNRETMNQAFTTTRRQLSNRFQWVQPLGEKNIFKLTSLYTWEELPQRLTVSPGIFPELLNDSVAYTSFQQSVKQRNFYTKNATDWQFKLFDFYVGTQIGIDYQREELVSGISGTGINEDFNTSHSFVNDVCFSDLHLHATPHLQYQQKSFRMSLRFLSLITSIG
ncbi:MAG: hypothetical protein ACTTKN_04420 [Phocaeicola sp.]|uniref:hypothetical protein n=1 Tax=Phocaeicola sp. TaxID=2773926 RepID=UPI003F9F8631